MSVAKGRPSLKSKIAAAKAAHAAEVAAAQARAAAADKAADKAARAEAEKILAGIPEAVADALKRGSRSVGLYRAADVSATVENNASAVVRHLVAALADENLLDALWVDIDCSGNWVTQHELRMTI